MFSQRQGNSITVQTPAKLNLFLEVLGKRADGYHDLFTVMTAIDRFDRLTIRLTDRPVLELDCRWDPELEAATVDAAGWGDLPTGEDNLVTRTARHFLNKIRANPGLEIELIKTIPSQAGLGGASGNAAGTLIALNDLLGTGVAIETLSEWAAELGSDIPFFLEGGMALCEGRGELVTPLPDLRSLDFVVVKPLRGLSTPEIFSRLEPPTEPRRIPQKRLREQDVDWGELAFNRLEEPASQLYGEIRRIGDRLRELGCRAALMTGSGSCCYGICEHAEQAKEIAGQLARMNSGFVFTCRNLPKFSVRG